MNKDFISKLKQYQNKLGVSQAQMCEILYGVPYRTYQSWCLGEKLPPSYYQKLIISRLESFHRDADR